MQNKRQTTAAGTGGDRININERRCETSVKTSFQSHTVRKYNDRLRILYQLLLLHELLIASNKVSIIWYQRNPYKCLPYRSIVPGALKFWKISVEFAVPRN